MNSSIVIIDITMIATSKIETGVVFSSKTVPFAELLKIPEKFIYNSFPELSVKLVMFPKHNNAEKMAINDNHIV
ncbi:MAG: hypothetical protein ABFD02_16270 [Bacteroidales bacterium]